MQNNSNGKVTPLKARGLKADAPPDDPESMKAATASSRPITGLACALGFRPLWAALGLAVVLLFILIYYRSTPLEFQNVPQVLAQKLQTLSALRINFLKSIEAEKLAVMAETDESSIAFAYESKRAAEAVEADLKELSRLIVIHPGADESKLLQDFEAAWEQVRKIDQVILDLAVQNTNLKAFRLSFGKGREIVERFEYALTALTRDVTVARFIREASDALTAEIKILTLHAPHIVSPNDEEMSQIERVIREKEDVVQRSLATLAHQAPADKQPYVSEAVTANREFRVVTATVLKWSRENTNVNSLNLSLDRKQKATALCEAALNQLHEAFARQAFKATR